MGNRICVQWPAAVVGGDVMASLVSAEGFVIRQPVALLPYLYTYFIIHRGSMLDRLSYFR